MTVKKGSRVKYKIGKGHALGRVSAIRGDKAVITTGSGAEVTRSLSGLKHPDEKDEPELPAGHDTVTRVQSDENGGPEQSENNGDRDDEEFIEPDYEPDDEGGENE